MLSVLDLSEVWYQDSIKRKAAMVTTLDCKTFINDNGSRLMLQLSTSTTGHPSGTEGETDHTEQA